MTERPPRARESAATKGRRYLTEGRLNIERVGDGLIVASCRGDQGDVYALGYDSEKREWRCACPALRRCSHLVALQLVVERPSSENGRKS